MAVPDTLKVTVIPASTKTGRAIVEALLLDSRKPKVTGYYRDLAKVPSSLLSNPDFTAVKGDVCDSNSLDFEGADAILAVTPPRPDGNDMEKYARTTSENVRNAILKARTVKRLVYLSSMGAQFESGVGEIKTNHIAETILSDASFDTTYLRAAYLMENLLPTITQAKTNHTIPTSIPHDWAIPMVSIHDLAQASVQTLLARFSGAGIRRRCPIVVDVHGPRAYDARDLEMAFAQAAGGQDVVKVESVPRECLADYFCRVCRVPVNLVPEYVEMARSFLPGGVVAAAVGPSGWVGEQSVRRGDRELVDVVRSGWEEQVVV